MSGAPLQTYRSIGPFDESSLPAALLAEHRLKPGCWGRLEVTAGTVLLVWDDAAGGCERLSTGDVVQVPPQRPHHLEPVGPFTLSIDFQRSG